MTLSIKDIEELESLISDLEYTVNLLRLSLNSVPDDKYDMLKNQISDSLISAKESLASEKKKMIRYNRIYQT